MIFPSDCSILALHLQTTLVKEAFFEKQISLKIYWVEQMFCVDFADLSPDFMNSVPFPDPTSEAFSFFSSTSYRIMIPFTSVTSIDPFVDQERKPEESTCFLTIVFDQVPLFFSRPTFTSSLRNPWIPVEDPSKLFKNFPKNAFNSISVTIPSWETSKQHGPHRNRNLIKRISDNFPPLFNPEDHSLTRNSAQESKTAQGQAEYLAKFQFFAIPLSKSKPNPPPPSEPATKESTQKQSKKHPWNWASDLFHPETFLCHLAKCTTPEGTAKAAKENFTILYRILETKAQNPQLEWFDPDLEHLFAFFPDLAKHLELSRETALVKASGKPKGKQLQQERRPGGFTSNTIPPVAFYFKERGKEPPPPPTCHYCCRTEAPDVRLLNCAKCKQVAYCSKSCQVADWKEFHKRECSQFAKDA